MEPKIAATDDNRFVLAWRRYMNTSSGSFNDIYYTIRDTGGGTVKPVTQFTSDTAGYDEGYYYPNLTQLSGNRALFAWYRDSDDDAYYAVLDSAGNTVKGATNLSNGYGWGARPDAAQLSDGKIVVAWGGSMYFAVLGSAYNRIAGPTWLSNPAAVTGDGYVSVAAAGDEAVLTWTDSDYDYRRNLYYALVDGDGNTLTDPMIFHTSESAYPYVETSYNGYGNTSLSFEVAAPTISEVDYPAAWSPGAPVTVTWRVSGAWLQEVDLYWDIASHSSDNGYGSTTTAESLGGGQYRAVATMPASGKLYFKAHARNIASEETWSAEYNIQAQWLRPVITSHVGGTTNDATPTLGGAAAAGSTVEVYEGASQIATTTASGAGTFEVTLPSSLSDGAHVLTVLASKGGIDSPHSSPLNLTVDSNSKIDPIGVEITTPDLTQRLRDEDGQANLDEKSHAWVRDSEDVTFTLPVTGTNVISVSIDLVGPGGSNQVVELEKDPTDPELWNGDALIPSTGLYTATVHINDDGTIEDAILGQLISDEEGNVRDRQSDTPLDGVQLTVWYFDTQTNRWEKWDGSPWGQENPLVTSEDGLYQFSPYPAGLYHVTAEKDQYWTLTSDSVEVTAELLRPNIQLQPRYDIYMPVIMRNGW